MRIIETQILEKAQFILFNYSTSPIYYNFFPPSADFFVGGILLPPLCGGRDDLVCLPAAAGGGQVSGQIPFFQPVN